MILGIIGLVIAFFTVIGVIVAVWASIARTPVNLRGFYGEMFRTIALVGIIGMSVVAALALF